MMVRPAYWWASRLVAVIGICFTLVFFTFQQKLEAQRREGSIRHFATDYLKTITERTALVGERLMVVGNLMSSMPDISEHQFVHFAQALMESRLALQSLQWAPKVTRANGDEAFRVQRMEPYVASAPAIGTDLMGDPAYRTALEKARDSGLMVATPPLVLERGERRQVSTLAVFPVYAAGTAVDTVDQRRAGLSGFVVGLVRVDTLVDFALAGDAASMFDLVLIDPSAAGTAQILFSQRADPNSAPPDLVGQAANRDMLSMPLTMGGQNWQLLVTPNAAFERNEGASIARLLLIFGLIATAAIVTIVHLLLAGNTRTTQLVRARTQELSFHRSLLTALIETSPTAVLVVSPDRRWVLWNHKFLSIWSIPPETLDDVDRHNGLDFVLPQIADQAGFMQAVDDIYAQPDVVRRDEILLRDGRMLERHTAPVVGDDGTMHGRSWFFFDITDRALFEGELRQARDNAEAASRAKSDFLATMSHEIRTPMNGVLGMAEILQMTELTDEQKDYLKVIKDCGSSLLTILNDILDFSKIEAGKMEMEARAFTPAAVVEDAVALMRGRAIEKAVELRVALNDDLTIQLVGDANRLRQVLINLIGNAIKFTSEGSVDVSLQLAERGPEAMHLRVDVADSGIGIAQDTLPLLFAPFVQADSTTTRRFGGTGLGLAICKRLIDAMGGRIGVESSPGQGSRFWFELILPTAPAEIEPDQLAATGPAEKVWAGFHVLVAEDDPINARVASELLQNQGLSVTVVDNGRLAVETQQRYPAHVILMDVQMPFMDGHEATRRIRALEAAAVASSASAHRVPIIAFTANAFENDRQLAIDAGMDDFIAKPFRESSLLATIHKWLPAEKSDA